MVSKKNDSTIIILQEQNSFPGITTRLFANKANKICIAFEEPNRTLGDNTVITGNPVRKGISEGNKSNGFHRFRLKEKNKTIFLFGGSQGSAYLNRLIGEVAEKISNGGIQLLWQTGDLEFSKYNHLESEKVRIVPFVNNMADAYAISDLIVCRSGALTLAEITVCGKPSILIPFQFAAGDHQKKNAEALVSHNAAHILDEKTLTPKLLLYNIY